jgi:hypothetical protein
MTDREINTLALRGLEEPAHASRGLEEPFFQLCCCVSIWFWREIGFDCTYYYVLWVPYSCGVVLVFLVLAGNIFWCYVHTWCTIQLCSCVIFFVVARKLILYEIVRISSTWTKTNTNLLHSRSIHSISRKIGHVIQIVVHQYVRKTISKFFIVLVQLKFKLIQIHVRT